jgi:hypothetical protein
MQAVNRRPRHAILLSGRFFFIAVAGLLCVKVALADDAMAPIRLVDEQTAGVVPKGDYNVESRIYEGDGTGTGLLVDVMVGITDRFTLGLGYGGEGILGRESDPHYDPYPGCLVKYRLFDESIVYPGCAVGFDYQGYGGIADPSRYGYEGYIYKSEGFFTALSKSYLFLNKVPVGFHGNVNLSLEQIQIVKWPDVVAGCDVGVSRTISMVAEYDFGLNTQDPYGGATSYARPQDGYLNVGLRGRLAKGLLLELDARDILQHRSYLYMESDEYVKVNKLGWSRELKIVYQTPIQ